MVNMGSADRIIRLVVGVVLLIGVFALGWGGLGWLKWVLALVGIVLAVTAVAGVCPAYLPFGIRTCPAKK